MLITEHYRAQQKELHEKIASYGSASIKFAPIVTELLNKYQVKSMLDYGAGKGRLGQNIAPERPVHITHYEPAREEWSNEPEPDEFVACIDVLEHIEPECLEDVLDDLKRVTRNIGFFTVHTGPAGKTLPDGRNAHLIQEGRSWWVPKFEERFCIEQQVDLPNGFYIVVRALL